MNIKEFPINEARVKNTHPNGAIRRVALAKPHTITANGMDITLKGDIVADSNGVVFATKIYEMVTINIHGLDCEVEDYLHFNGQGEVIGGVINGESVTVSKNGVTPYLMGHPFRT